MPKFTMQFILSPITMKIQFSNLSEALAHSKGLSLWTKFDGFHNLGKEFKGHQNQTILLNLNWLTGKARNMESRNEIPLKWPTIETLIKTIKLSDKILGPGIINNTHDLSFSLPSLRNPKKWLKVWERN